MIKVGIDTNTIGSLSLNGLSLTESSKLKSNVTMNICADKCYDPAESVMISTESGLSGVTMDGSYRREDTNVNQNYLLPNSFQTTKYMLV